MASSSIDLSIALSDDVLPFLDPESPTLQVQEMIVVFVLCIVLVL